MGPVGGDPDELERRSSILRRVLKRRRHIEECGTPDRALLAELMELKALEVAEVKLGLQEVQSEALDMPAAIVAQAGLLHQQFKAAARAGGGWVQYEWAEAGESAYQKLAYIFSFHRDGIEYYGGEHRTVL